VGAVVKNVGLPAKGEPLPMLVTAGLGYSPARPITLAFDFNYPFSFDPADQPAERWFLASGLDVAVTPFLSLQGGFRLKENPRVSVGASLDLNRIGFTANYNLDLSGSVNPADKFSLEAKLNLGDDGRAALRRQVDELYANGLESFARGEFEEAIREWESALDLESDFRPAIEAIETARERLELQDEMIRRQQVE
jgi:tetratricopeptide (TPR) repeat protein